MLQFNHSMDPHSLSIIRDGKDIGYLQWHPDRTPRVVLPDSFGYVSLQEMQECIDKLNAVRGIKS